MDAYPNHWPKPDPKMPHLVQTRITEGQKRDLYRRLVTTRALAKELGVHEKYLSHLFPGKVKVINKKLLIEARKLFKLEVAKKVLRGDMTVAQAAREAYVSHNTMKRFVDKAKAL